jgi:hypothetical protein
LSWGLLRERSRLSPAKPPLPPSSRRSHAQRSPSFSRLLQPLPATTQRWPLPASACPRRVGAKRSLLSGRSSSEERRSFAWPRWPPRPLPDKWARRGRLSRGFRSQPDKGSASQSVGVRFERDQCRRPLCSIENRAAAALEARLTISAPSAGRQTKRHSSGHRGAAFRSGSRASLLYATDSFSTPELCAPLFFGNRCPPRLLPRMLFSAREDLASPWLDLAEDRLRLDRLRRNGGRIDFLPLGFPPHGASPVGTPVCPFLARQESLPPPSSAALRP